MADIRWDKSALGIAIATDQAVVEEVTRATERINDAANAMGSGHLSGYYHPDHKSPGVGRTPAAYACNVRQYPKSVVGIVHTANYSAMQDNAENNTLLKARG